MPLSNDIQRLSIDPLRAFPDLAGESTAKAQTEQAWERFAQRLNRSVLYWVEEDGWMIVSTVP